MSVRKKSTCELCGLPIGREYLLTDGEHEYHRVCSNATATSVYRQLKDRCEQAEAKVARQRHANEALLSLDTAKTERIAELEAKVGRLKAETKFMQQFWMTAMMAVRFYHELGDEFDCKAAMASLAEAAEEDEAADLERRWTERTRP